MWRVPGRIAIAAGCLGAALALALVTPHLLSLGFSFAAADRVAKRFVAQEGQEIPKSTPATAFWLKGDAAIIDLDTDYGTVGVLLERGKRRWIPTRSWRTQTGVAGIAARGPIDLGEMQVVSNHPADPDPTPAPDDGCTLFDSLRCSTIAPPDRRRQPTRLRTSVAPPDTGEYTHPQDRFLDPAVQRP